MGKDGGGLPLTPALSPKGRGSKTGSAAHQTGAAHVRAAAQGPHRRAGSVTLPASAASEEQGEDAEGVSGGGSPHIGLQSLVPRELEARDHGNLVGLGAHGRAKVAIGAGGAGNGLGAGVELAVA